MLIDSKTIGRLLADLVGLGMLHLRTFNVSRSNLSSATDTKKGTEFLFAKSVDMEDDALLRTLMAGVSLVKERVCQTMMPVMTSEQAPAVERTFTRDPGQVRISSCMHKRMC